MRPERNTGKDSIREPPCQQGFGVSETLLCDEYLGQAPVRGRLVGAEGEGDAREGLGPVHVGESLRNPRKPHMLVDALCDSLGSPVQRLDGLRPVGPRPLGGLCSNEPGATVVRRDLRRDAGIGECLRRPVQVEKHARPDKSRLGVVGHGPQHAVQTDLGLVQIRAGAPGPLGPMELLPEFRWTDGLPRSRERQAREGEDEKERASGQHTGDG